MPPFQMTLRCQTVVDGVLAYVELPVGLEEWDSADEETRHRIHSMARTELRISVGARIGEARLDDRYEDLPVWEQYADRCEVECVGGPLDGERIKLSSAEPPLSLVLPAPFRLEDVVASATVTTERIPTVMYSPLPDESGFFSRATDGAWRFGPVDRAA
ncbi:hypothetical protein OIA45_49035 (plasmid) [Streptomyces chartreusis]|uniref:hypothetical protein n=1 Tax=Streptomyces chartreusis TaxID=1969 RepID=UPI0037DD7866|nr:hypothetical protein OIA45_49035 [Streptomyces chartreusis]